MRGLCLGPLPALGITLLVSAAAAPAALAQDATTASFERTLSVSGPVELEVSTGSGRIEIRAGAAGRVQVTGRIRVGDSFFRRSDADQVVRDIQANPPIEQTGNSIRIGRLDRSLFRDNVSISYEIVVPAAARARSNTGSGSQDITGIQGPVEATTGSGSIRVSNVANDINTHTGSGSIVAQGVKGAFRGQTGSGRIEVEGTQGGRWDLGTGSGSILVRLPNQAAFDLDAHTGSGSITINHPLTVTGRIRRNEMAGRVRGGGVVLYARTGSGSIRIE